MDRIKYNDSKAALLPLVLMIILCGCSFQKPSAGIIKDGLGGPSLFASSEIEASLESQGYELSDDPEITIRFLIDTSLDDQAYNVKKEGEVIVITGGGENGMMYGGIELSEKIRLREDIRKLVPFEGNPYMKYRGLRFNIPLDARTPSYDDTGDAAQKNIETMWDFEFWKFYLDMMAKNRYNLLTLWNLHPYPSWVKVPDYPDVALDDVCVYTGDINSKTDMKWIGEDIQNPSKLKVVKKMTIDEKIAFWKKVFEYAEERGVEIFLFHWNVFVNGAEGKHGIEWRQDNPVTVDYMRKSVKQMLLTYPQIKGIGVTAGEHVDRKLTNQYNTENWMWLTYGQGIMDAKEVNPGLNVRFIFRQHWSSLDKIMEIFSDYDGQFDTEFKYSRARMYSSVTPPWFDRIFRADVEWHGLKCWQNVRNDDIFVFRWGDPGYAASYIRNIPADLTAGFFMGPDGYVYGREFISKNPRSPRQWDIDRQWYNFMIWGRVSFNPFLPESFFEDMIGLRFPGINSRKLFETWKATSEVISWTDKIHFRQNDYMFAPEGCIGRDGFHDVNSFIAIGAMPEQGVTSIANYALQNENQKAITPLEVSVKLENAARVLISGSSSIKPGRNPELKETLKDLEAMGWLGRYYSHKIRGATFLARFRKTGEESMKTLAVEELESAVTAWERYAGIAGSIYLPQLLARTGMLDWNAILEYVKADVEIARKAVKGEEVRVVDYNILWNTEKSRI